MGDRHTAPSDDATALVFAGQGAQHHGMGARWRDNDAWSIIEHVAEASGHDVAELLLHADDETLQRTDRAQIATFAFEMVAWTYDRARGVAYRGCAGHSLGEYAALVAAGILDVGSAAGLVAARGAAMLEAARAHPGTMAAVISPNPDTVGAIIGDLQRSGARVWIANRNAPTQLVLAGDSDGVRLAADACRAHGKVLPLKVGGAFHSPLMAGAEPELRAALAAVRFAPGDPGVVANADARHHDGTADWGDLLTRQLTQPVRWADCVMTLAGELGCTAFVDIGPTKTISGLVRQIVPGAPITRVELPAR
ncbi:MAG: ACP S-malonyltransferase [Actinomycetota bacterium]